MITDQDASLLNVTYIKPSKDNDNDEYFEVIYKNSDGSVHMAKEEPNADIYIVKPEFRNFHYNKPQEQMSKMNKVTVPVSKIRYKIAEEMGEEGKAIIEKAYRTRDTGYLNQLYKWRYCFACDFQPEYYYMKNWYEHHPDRIPTLTKCFLDIECDQIDYRIDMDNIHNSADAPVNVVTAIFDDTLDSYTFVLKPTPPSKVGMSKELYEVRYKLYEKQKRQHEAMFANIKEYVKGLNESFDEIYDHIDYHLREYDEEIDLIADVFRLINLRKPNFCLIWNMRFDIQYLYHRIMALHYDPKSIMCHPDFKQQRCYFKVDKSTFMLEKQYDYFYCSSYTMYICQMRLYASIRKSQHKLKSVKLNDIADRELRDKKVEYPDETNFVLFPYKDWPRFIKYNIKDVLLQLGIERKTNDTKTYYNKSHTNLTPYNKIFRETHLLRNVREKYFNEDGWVQGNNLNIIDDNNEEDERTRRFYGIGSDYDEDEDEATFKGAINADPIWNDKIGKKIRGVRSNNVFENAVDFDMGAFYPSIKIASNMDPSTLIYKASFINEEFISGEFPNRSLNVQYVEKDKNGNTRKLDFTGEAVNTYASENILTFACQYLGLPTVTVMLKDVEKKINNNPSRKVAYA